MLREQLQHSLEPKGCAIRSCADADNFRDIRQSHKVRRRFDQLRSRKDDNPLVNRTTCPNRRQVPVRGITFDALLI